MNLFHNVKAQWLTYLAFFAAVAVVPLYVSDTLPAEPVVDLWRVWTARLVAELVLGLRRNSQSRAGDPVRARRLRHGDDDADAVAGRIEPNPAVHAQQQPRSFAAVVGAVPEHRSRHCACADRAYAVLPVVRRIDVPSAGVWSVLCDHDAGDVERVLHADHRRPALHQRRQRHHAAATRCGSRELRSIPTAPAPTGPCWRLLFGATCWPSS